MASSRVLSVYYDFHIYEIDFGIINPKDNSVIVVKVKSVSHPDELSKKYSICYWYSDSVQTQKDIHWISRDSNESTEEDVYRKRNEWPSDIENVVNVVQSVFEVVKSAYKMIYSPSKANE